MRCAKHGPTVGNIQSCKWCEGTGVITHPEHLKVIFAQQELGKRSHTNISTQGNPYIYIDGFRIFWSPIGEEWIVYHAGVMQGTFKLIGQIKSAFLL